MMLKINIELTVLLLANGYDAAVVVNGLDTEIPTLQSPVDKPLIAPRNVGGGGGKTGELTITWDPLRPEEQNGITIHYKVYYRLLGQEKWANEVLKSQGNVGRAVVHIPLDKYYTQYEVKVQAINDLGEGPISNETVIYSAEDTPLIVPHLLRAESFNSTALNVSWAQPVSQSRTFMRGQLVGFRLKYWKQGHNEKDAEYFLSRTTQPWALIVGLQPDTAYFVKAMAYNGAGEGPESERYLERTFKHAPQEPAPLSPA